MKTFIIAAITADGFIARGHDHGADWTGKADKKIFVELTREAGVMVMGSRTFATIGRALPDRRNIVYTSQPDRINVEDIETTNEAPAELIARLRSEGAAGVAICGGATIYSLFMEAGVVDELYLTVIPTLFGQGVGLFAGPLEQNLTLLDTKQLDENTLLLHYKTA